ncbi:hypothetical protein EU528_09135 [Candidatus Thorarchaeota archaeon]|nr:MAG: hypothetical protein EU528_09135 [Candidatus Thorarchaeota archaeon]
MTDNVEEKPEVRYLSVVRKEGGEPIIGIPYREMSVDPDLVASFVLAVIIFENRQLKNFAKEGYVVVIEEGEYVVGLLIVDRVDDDTPYRNALKEVIAKFEKTYESQMQAWKGDIRPFREFALDILQIYPYREFSLNMIPRLLTKSEATPDYQAQIPWSVGETDEKLQTILGYINGKRTIEEIMNQSEYEDSEVLAILSMLDRYQWITLTRKLEDTSILIKVMDPPRFLVGVYGEQLTSIVEQCDGKKSLAAICEALPYNMQAVKLVAKNLIDAGVLGYSDNNKEDKL